jgi:hypothetical protein
MQLKSATQQMMPKEPKARLKTCILDLENQGQPGFHKMWVKPVYQGLNFLIIHYQLLISFPYLCRPKNCINYGQSLSGYR